MKRLFTLLTAMSLSTFAFVQTNVTNPSFENWNDEVGYDSLDQWTTSNAQMYQQGYGPNVWHDDFDPQDGTYSLYLETFFEYNESTGEDDTLFAYVIKENVVSGLVGFPYSDTVDQFTFWYKCDVPAGDSAIALIELRNGGAVYASAMWKVTGTVSTWTEATVAIPGGSVEVPDTLSIGWASSDAILGTAEEGSVLEIDNVNLQFTAGSTVPTPLPNNSFETFFEYTYGEADEWVSFNQIMFANGGTPYAVESTDATNGTSSLEITTTAENVAWDIPALVTNGEFDLSWGLPYDGDAFIAQPAEMLYDYQYAPGATDTAICWLQIWNSGGSLVDTFIVYTNTVSAWTTDTIELSFSSAPDSINVLFFSGDSLGSQLKVDHIRFEGGDVGLNTIYLSDKWNVFPNPSNEITTVLFDKADRLSVINIAGQEIYSKTAFNSNKVELNTTDWPEGIYLIQKTNNGKVETKKLIVHH